MVHVEFNTVRGSDRAEVQSEVVSALQDCSESGHWRVSILGLDGRAGFLVAIESGERVVGGWTFDHLDHVRPRILQSLELLLA